MWYDVPLGCHRRGRRAGRLIRVDDDPKEPFRMSRPQNITEDLFTAAFVAGYIVMELLVALLTGGNRRG
jgi:hypothetical protein